MVNMAPLREDGSLHRQKEGGTTELRFSYAAVLRSSIVMLQKLDAP
jgi:hypothetical protein